MGRSRALLKFDATTQHIHGLITTRLDCLYSGIFYNFQNKIRKDTQPGSMVRMCLTA